MKEYLLQNIEEPPITELQSINNQINEINTNIEADKIQKLNEKILISFDKCIYNPGETVSGKIYITFDDSFSGKNILITYKIKEFVQYTTKEYDRIVNLANPPPRGGRGGKSHSKSHTKSKSKTKSKKKSHFSSKSKNSKNNYSYHHKTHYTHHSCRSHIVLRDDLTILRDDGIFYLNNNDNNISGDNNQPNNQIYWYTNIVNSGQYILDDGVIYDPTRYKQKIVSHSDKKIHCKFRFAIPIKRESKGKYIYPFSFILPRLIPNSFEYHDKNNNIGYIQHEVKAKVFNIIKPLDYYKAISLLIINNNNHSFGFPNPLQIIGDFSRCCHCCEQGIMMVTINNKDYNIGLNINELLEGTIKIDNSHSSLFCTEIQIFLENIINLEEKKSKYFTKKNCIYSQTINCNILPRTIENINFSIELKNILNNINDEFLNWKFSNIYGNNNELFRTLFTTCESNLIKNSNYLNVIATYNDSSVAPLEILMKIKIKVPDFNNESIIFNNSGYNQYMTLSGNINNYLNNSISYEMFDYKEKISPKYIAPSFNSYGINNGNKNIGNLKNNNEVNNYSNNNIIKNNENLSCNLNEINNNNNLNELEYNVYDDV